MKDIKACVLEMEKCLYEAKQVVKTKHENSETANLLVDVELAIERLLTSLEEKETQC